MLGMVEGYPRGHTGLSGRNRDALHPADPGHLLLRAGISRMSIRTNARGIIRFQIHRRVQCPNNATSCSGGRQ